MNRRIIAGAIAIALAACSSESATPVTSVATTTLQTTTTSTTTLPTVTAVPSVTPVTTDATDATETTDTTPAPWNVDTSVCADPAAAEAPITGDILVGSVMPLTGGIGAAAFGPVADGLRAYVDHANATGLLGDRKLVLTIADDQYDAAQTPTAITGLIAAGNQLVAGIVGTPNNAAVRQSLNDQCIPQLNAVTGSPEWGRASEYPWTTGLLVPYTIEAEVYASRIAQLHPQGTVALFTVDNDFGRAYVSAFDTAAANYGLQVVAAETIDPASVDPPTAQLAAIAAAHPDALLSAPLGVGCLTFLGELAAAKLRAAWTPDTFLTSTCASGLLLAAAGSSADGIYTSDDLRDLTAPDAAVQDYVAYMASMGKSGVVGPASVGWTAGEVTVAILRQAIATGTLSRASIIEAARNLVITPSLARPGVVDRSNGTSDPFLAESLQVVQYDADTMTFSDVGPLDTQFETP